MNINNKDEDIWSWGDDLFDATRRGNTLLSSINDSTPGVIVLKPGVDLLKTGVNVLKFSSVVIKPGVGQNIPGVKSLPSPGVMIRDVEVVVLGVDWV